MALKNVFSIAVKFRSSIVIVFAPVFLLPIIVVGQTSAAKCAYGLCLMAIYWTTEACPLAVTSLLPIILFPLLGVLTADQVSMAYTRQVNFLFIGGLIMAVAIEHWNLHRRMALKVLTLLGSKPCWVMLGFMSMTAVLSMWISNTATAAMMIPIAMAVHSQMTNIQKSNNRDDTMQETSCMNGTHSGKLEENANEDQLTEIKTTSGELQNQNSAEIQSNQLRKALLLCVAYSANIGGFATLIGTPSNLILPGTLDSVFGEGASDSVDFVAWFGFSFPISLTCLLITWIWLQIRFFGIRSLWKKGDPSTKKRVSQYLKRSYEELGPIKFGEIAVFAHFILLILLWLTRDPKIVSGWKDGLNLRLVKDSTCAIFVSFSLFVFPSKNPFRWFMRNKNNKQNQEENEKIGPSPPLLEWKTAQSRLAWDVVLLIGAGFALAKACEDSKLTEWIGEEVSGLSEISPAAFAVIISITISLLTEFTSNVSTASIFIPVLCRLAADAGINPLYIVIPATISCSFAFSLPVATPPNAIAFSYGSLKVKDLVTSGLVLNFVCVGILNIFLNTTGIAIFDLNSQSALLTSNPTQFNETYTRG